MNKLALWSFAMITMACGEVLKTPPDADVCETPGVCNCTVATEDADCGAHEYCNESVSGRDCECVAGYTKGLTGCVWTGAIQDPGFAMDRVWTPVNGALTNPTAAGGVDPGEASFLPSTLCSLGHVKQNVDMPTFAKAEPLVLELTYKNQLDFQNSDRVLMGILFGNSWSPFPFFNDPNFHSIRICLPEGAYAPSKTTGKGAPVTFGFGPYLQPDRCPNSSVTNFAVDHAAIVSANAGECGTTFGEGVNFDAETPSGGWTFTVSGTSTGGFAAGIGANGTRAARVTLAKRCETAVLETSFNVPMVANPALDIFVGAGAGANPTLSFVTLFSTSVFDAVSAQTQTRRLHMCLPPSLRGQTMRLSLSVSGGAGLCADTVNLQTFADDVRVVDDPACVATESFTSIGFEQAAVPWGAFALKGASTANAAIGSAAGQAHGGTRYLALESNGRCSNSGYAMLPIVPPSSGNAGPALKFFANVGVNADASTSAGARGSMSLQLTEGGGYRPYTICLNPLYAGRPQMASISHFGGGGTCDNSNYVQQNAFIDDIEVTTDPTCPAQ